MFCLISNESDDLLLTEIYVKRFVTNYWQNKRLQIIHFTCSLNLSSGGERIKKSMYEVLTQSNADYFKYLRLLIKRYQKQRFTFTFRVYRKSYRTIYSV